ncbi:hypothetical protein [Ectobacillus panaciterrae]|uniref:hypothetical protein n=1 Tax=Ectobacillus panaciterrae TaxID=363872 RepID=UPI0003F5ECAB
MKENDRVTDNTGYWNWQGANPEDWIHAAVSAAKQDSPGIVNDMMKDWFLKAAVSQVYKDKWREAVMPTNRRKCTKIQI